MANLKASKIDIRKTAKRRVQNAQQRARLRTYDKNIRQLVEENKIEEARAMLKVYVKFLDRAGKVHLIHQNQADRRKSRMALFVNKAVGTAKSA